MSQPYRRRGYPPIIFARKMLPNPHAGQPYQRKDLHPCVSLSVRAQLKAWLKPILVSCWNTAHHSGWVAHDYLRAILRGRFERCVVCGRFGPMLYRRRVIPRRLEELWGLTPRLAEALARKESCDCTHCGTRLRGRRIARVLLRLYGAGGPSAAVRTLERWVEQAEIRALRIAEINPIDGLHDQLARLPYFSGSDHDPTRNPGAPGGSAHSEDLSHLTYCDGSFDLVLTSETLEHVPELQAALREIHRVLAPGGRHVFTIPLLPGVPATFARSIVLPDGSIEDRAPRISHPGGDWGYPVFTEFGADLPAILERAGFETEVVFGPAREDDLAQVYVCRKPAS
jgi:SAM-dependent methyltransferase